MKPSIVCGDLLPLCGRLFTPRYEGQKAGFCDHCNAERTRLRNLHRSRVTAKIQEEEEIARRIEAITHRVSMG